MKTNRYYQSTFMDHPALRKTSKGPRIYRSADTSNKGVPHIAGTMKIVVGAESKDQRTWELPKALLSRHSDMFKSIFTADTVSEVQLPTISPDAFANFSSYMHSSIYSTNTKVAGYRSIRAHANACLLAAKLEADKYWEAAMRQLYSLLLPLARSRRSDAKQSFIRAGDIEYICVNATAEKLKRSIIIDSSPFANDNPFNSEIRPTVKDSLPDAPPLPPRKGYHSHDVGAMEGLRTLFFDALASHWTQYDVIYIGAQDSPRGGGFNKNDVPGDTTTWRQVCDTYPDFHAHIGKTTGHANAWRTALLRHIDVYLDPADPQLLGQQGRRNDGVTIKIEDVDEIKEEEVDDDDELEMEKATRRPKLTLKLTGLRRSNSRERTENSEEVALSGVKRESEDEILEDGEINESEGSTLVDGETEGREEAPEDRMNQDEEMAEGMDDEIEEEPTSAGY
ncbi:uncharacterized protein ALTATR162_LOCUS2654 [Alternaria atra]|uniref:BTB domain-containing protein n=1 Tax=Alternaria atra TaxID=119953 RepID=A0A8J2MXK6_9PLEO|nr:uncharacterized protein ALTATR162_LOCUS2654 [Alternaria atra]CAG5150423.1 unnamed protein product [Alternaria atra]